MPSTRIRDLEIRPCRPGECAAVLALWHAHHAPSTTDRLEDVVRLVEDFDGQLLVATSGGRIIGAVIAGWDGWRGHLHHLAIQPDVRRQGVATALVLTAERLLVARGAKRISVLAERDNLEAIAFYESLRAVGYALDLRMHRYVRTIDVAGDAPGQTV
jgi:ribosomal protein S18 acetylase RimI-like enzyme